VGSQVIAFLRPGSRGSDWTREELAELYRIEHALVQAHMTVETDRGTTDEGDPWFVFCRRDGEVLVHVTRMGGEYALHSPALTRSLHGRTFPALTKSFVDHVPVTLPLRSAPGAKLFVHPAAMMAVIIGTIFIASQDTSNSFNADKADPAVSLDERQISKAGLQGAFHAFIDLFLVGMREWSATAQPYLAFVTAIAAFMLETTSVLNSDQEQSAAHASLPMTIAEDNLAFDLLAAGSGNVERLPSPQPTLGLNALQEDDRVPAAQIAPDDNGAHLRALSVAEFSPAKVPTGELAWTHNGAEDDAARAFFKADQDFLGAVLDFGQSTPTTIDRTTAGQGSLASTNSATSHSADATSPVSPLETILHGLKLDFSAAMISFTQPTSSAFSDAVLLISHELPLQAGGSTPLASTNGALSAYASINSEHGAAANTLAPTISNESTVPARTAESVAPTPSASSASASNGGTTVASGSTIPATTASGDTSATAAATSVNNNIDQIQLFNDAAVATVNTFLHTNPSAQILFDSGGNLFIYDGHRELDANHPLTIQLWETDAGHAVALIGHADSGSAVA
jgi:hypothetical protein